MQTVIENIFNFISTHFEIVLLINFTWVVTLIVIGVVLRVREIRLRHIRIFFEKLLFFSVVIGETILLVVCAYVYWINYERRSPVTLDDRLLLHTRWVKEHMTIFYVEGNDLRSIDTDGSNRKYIFEGNHKIREYHFSPDGKYILIVTENDLVLLDRKENKAQPIETLLATESVGGKFKGVISGVRWAPDSQKLCYEVARWSPFSSQNNYYLYT